MFFWLLIAFIVDGIDGPLARHFDVLDNAKRIDGVLLDLIIDYLTYVFIPAFALFQSGLLSGWTGWFTTLVITFTSSLYFADTRMKTADKSFSGFPSCWNMVVLVLFAIEPTFLDNHHYMRCACYHHVSACQVHPSSQDKNAGGLFHFQSRFYG